MILLPYFSNVFLIPLLLYRPHEDSQPPLLTVASLFCHVCGWKVTRSKNRSVILMTELLYFTMERQYSTDQLSKSLVLFITGTQQEYQFITLVDIL